ncbi:MAG: fructose-6-phosphate aldolase [Peptococcaceae bacterium]|nr:fructose-6-phosphate aldolase [Peptococcaceae bacterium]
MQFFLDSADFAEIQEAWGLGVISGITTNPSLVAKTGEDFHSLIRRICVLVDEGVAVNAEVMAADADGMVREAAELTAIHPNVVVKIPMTAPGLQAVKRLSPMGIRTNVTLVFTPAQALLAAAVGATYVSAFLGRFDDVGEDGVAALTDIRDIFVQYGSKCKIIAASVRHPVHVLQAALVGVDIATVPFKVLRQLYEHPLTQQGIEKFNADWEKSQLTVGAYNEV